MANQRQIRNLDELMDGSLTERFNYELKRVLEIRKACTVVKVNTYRNGRSVSKSYQFYLFKYVSN